MLGWSAMRAGNNRSAYSETGAWIYELHTGSVRAPATS
jgi:hypothetical protein